MALLFWGYLVLLALGLFWLLLFNAFTNPKSNDEIDTLFTRRPYVRNNNEIE